IEKFQLGRSLKNLRVECLDVYYLHNPETQLSEIAKPEFLDRLRTAFEFPQLPRRILEIRRPCAVDREIPAWRFPIAVSRDCAGNRRPGIPHADFSGCGQAGLSGISAPCNGCPRQDLSR